MPILLQGLRFHWVKDRMISLQTLCVCFAVLILLLVLAILYPIVSELVCFQLVGWIKEQLAVLSTQILSEGTPIFSVLTLLSVLISAQWKGTLIGVPLTIRIEKIQWEHWPIELIKIQKHGKYGISMKRWPAFTVWANTFQARYNPFAHSADVLSLNNPIDIANQRLLEVVGVVTHTVKDGISPEDRMVDTIEHLRELKKSVMMLQLRSGLISQHHVSHSVERSLKLIRIIPVWSLFFLHPSMLVRNGRDAHRSIKYPIKEHVDRAGFVFFLFSVSIHIHYLTRILIYERSDIRTAPSILDLVIQIRRVIIYINHSIGDGCSFRDVRSIMYLIELLETRNRLGPGYSLMLSKLWEVGILK